METSSPDPEASRTAPQPPEPGGPADGMPAIPRDTEHDDDVDALYLAEGPVLRNPREFYAGKDPVTFGNQISFHTSTATDLLNGFLQ